jgi:isoquinoline 1-oxidoreductase subunit beta
MNSVTIINESRRAFLQSGVAALTLSVLMPAALAQNGPRKVASAGAPLFTPNAFVEIGTDSSVTVLVKHVEMGQGTYTGLPTLVAEELDADWTQVRVEGAPADPRRYNNLSFGEVQGTGASTSLANSFDQLRMAGATARAMLVSVAARRWAVPESEISVSRGLVSHRSGRRARFGDLVEEASRLPVPTQVKLKDAAAFVYIGKHVPRTDSRAKSTGAAIYTQDIKLPGMLTAVVARAPRFGAKVRSFDAAKVRAVKGVVDVVAFATPVTNGVAVLARDFWAAKLGRDALTVHWDESAAFKRSSADILAEYRTLAERPGAVARWDGDPDQALAAATRTFTAAYEFPFLAHASMEPMNCVVQLTPDGCEVWNGEQWQTVDQTSLAQLLGLKPEQMKLNQLFAGGSFGRRANPYADFVLEAGAIAKASGRGVPIKMVWTREDDMRGGYYRPMYVHVLKGGLDATGNIVAWHHRIVGQSILTETSFESLMVRNGIDHTSVEGAYSLPYAIPNLAVELHSPRLGVPVQWWRSVGSTHNAFSTETFLDELAAAAGRDPYELRRTLLEKHQRHKGVLELAAEKAGWGTPLATGAAGDRRGRGIAVHESFDTVVANVAEVTIRADAAIKVDRVVCAVNCGIAVNPDIVRAQMEGGIGFGLSAALREAITLKEGMVEQSNFHDYEPLRMGDAPQIEVHIVPSTEKPTGVGEPGTPVIAPAVANAIFAATGKRLHNLPLGTKLSL